MEHDDAHIQQYVEILQKQKAQLDEAKAFKGRKPSASMKRSRQQLEEDFAMLVGSGQAKLSTKMISNIFVGTQSENV